MSENSLIQVAMAELEAAGFFVEREARRPPGTTRKIGNREPTVLADLAAWSGDEHGELTLDAIVEVKASRAGDIGGALAQLSRIAAVMGARRAFFFDGLWREADPSFTRFEPTNCPKPQLSAADARAPRHLLERATWAMRQHELGDAGLAGSTEWIDRVVQAVETASDTSFSRLCAAPSNRISLARILSEGADELEVPEALTDALTRLLAPQANMSILDPTCKLGATLWSVAATCPTANLRGWWPNEGVVGTARRLGALCGVRADLATANFDEVVSKSVAVDAIVSVPPFGVRLREPVGLADGGRSADLNIALLDRVSTWLKPSGRAALVVPPLVLFGGGSAEILRRRLAAELRVVSIIQLPPGVFTATRIPVAIVVLERRPPTETLVAQLRDDWQLQLSDRGDFFRAYQGHLHRHTS